MNKNFVIALFILMFFAAASASPVLAQKKDPDAAKKELRLKACGTEKVDYTESTDKTQHPTPPAPADKAMIYVLRTQMLGYKVNTKLAMDGKWMGMNRGKTYFFFTVEPGEHFFCSEAENQDYLALTVEAGKVYYLKQGIEMGVWKARTSLSVLDNKKGEEELKDLNLSVFTVKGK